MDWTSAMYMMPEYTQYTKLARHGLKMANASSENSSKPAYRMNINYQRAAQLLIAPTACVVATKIRH
jgi:hypothetical protein